jgi:hypothetical protein
MPEWWRAGSRSVPPRYVGWFFLWTSGIHVGIVAAGTDFYRHFADQALVPGLSAAWRSAYMSHATAGGLTVAAGEALLGLLLLSPAWARRRWGWAGTIAFHVALMCFGWGFWLWSLPALALLVPGARADRTTPDGPGSSRPMTVARRVR